MLQVNSQSSIRHCYTRAEGDIAAWTQLFLFTGLQENPQQVRSLDTSPTCLTLEGIYSPRMQQKL